MKPLLAAAATEVGDDQLVEAVREGSEEAFEALFRRYRPRIVAYVRGMVSDHARAEDIAQEAFMSALRGLRSSRQEIAFRPWMYEIAKNACIDHLRRSGRGAEVSIDSDDFSPHEEGQISASVSGTDAEVARRNELESLQMAFGDLPASQHRILVMRELEGLSYDRIGSRMGLSRGAVESLLFRARRTLKDGFEEIDTGERCLRMRVAMEAVADGRRTGLRERRRLTIHLRDCAVCRRTAVAIGLDELALAAARDRGHALRRVAGFLPLPAFLRRRVSDAANALNSAGPAAENGLSLAGKATAVVVAAALAAGGAGVAHKASGGALGLPGGVGGNSTGDRGGTGAGGDSSGNGGGSSLGGPAGPGGSAGAQNGGPGGAAGGAGAPGAPGAGAGRRDAAGRTQLPSLDGAGRAGEGATRIPGSLGGTVGGTVDRTTGTAGSLTESTGKVIQGTGERVGGVVDKTVGGVTDKVAPTRPKVKVPEVETNLPKTGGGSTTLPDASPPSAPKLQVPQTPTLRLPETNLPLPDTGLGLP